MSGAGAPIGRRAESLAVALGAAAGTLPIFALRAPVVRVFARWWQLDPLLTATAARLGYPLLLLVPLTQWAVGAWLRHPSLRAGDHVWRMRDEPVQAVLDVLLDVFFGALVISPVTGAVAGVLTWAALARAPALPPQLDSAIDRAARRFLGDGITAWQFARSKLRQDPVYVALLGALPVEWTHAGGTLVDIGCGQGLSLALLIETRGSAAMLQAHSSPRASSKPSPTLVGIESRPRIAAIAARALVPDAEVISAFAPAGIPEQFTAALLFDVLHLMDAATQQTLLLELRTRIVATGSVFVREVDAAAGIGFGAVRIGNRLKNIVAGELRQRFHFRTASEWRQRFEEWGWTVTMVPMGEGTPFANVLFQLRAGPSSLLQPLADADQLALETSAR